jgi:hypothetical protein
MHRHDLNTIAALADGSLKDETQARALVESCDECRVEYESHKVVIAALAAVEPVTMTDLEKAALHRDLWTDLRADAAPAVKTPPWWYRWSYAAAGVFVVVGLVGVVSQLGGVSTSDSAAPEVFEAPDDASGVAGLGTEDDGGADEVGADEAATDEAEVAETTIAAAEDAGNGAETLSRSLDAATFSLLVEQARSVEPTSSEAAATFSNDATARRAAECVEEAGLSAQEVVGKVEASTMYLLTVAIGEEFDADTVFTVVDFETCQVLSVEN